MRDLRKEEEVKLTHRAITRTTLISLGLLGPFGIFAPRLMGFTPSTTQMSFVPITPCRAVDTRFVAATSNMGSPSLLGGVERDFALWSSSTCTGIPSNVQAYALNITVIPSTKQLGYITVWSAGDTQPQVSTLNSPNGAVIANAATVAAGTNGSVALYASDMTTSLLT